MNLSGAVWPLDNPAVSFTRLNVKARSILNAWELGMPEAQCGDAVVGRGVLASLQTVQKT